MSGGTDGQKAVAPIEKKLLDVIVRHAPSVPEANYAYHSQGDLTFVNRAAEWGLGDPGFSSGAAYADFDNDGDMDLVVNNVNAPSAIYKNLLYHGINSKSQIPNSQANANYLKVKLKGGGQNTFGIGAKIILHYQDKIYFQELMPTRGFQSSVEPVLNFGLGNITRLDSLRVIWPAGQYQVLKNLPANQSITLSQAEAIVSNTYSQQNNIAPMFQDVTNEVQLDYSHRENKFIEYNREPFIPHFVATEGPAFAIAEANGHGLDDRYLGGGKLQPGGIYLQQPEGGFRTVYNPDFATDYRSEDVDAAFFDADGDGLSDLYVVSGGNEFFGRQEPVRDRLYLNAGNGKFNKTNGLLPEIYANGACVKPADVDNDGDMDLFVGSRSVQWQYGFSPKSYLLINGGDGKVTDKTGTLAPGLS